jgi:Na+-translocating ferredoxin:NAD+ oxidoreductase RnfC subunit
MNKRMSDIARQAGIVGAGGAGFPTHVKLDARVETVILNGAECEPLMSVDQNIMLRDADLLAGMLEKVRLDLGAGEAIIGIKAKHEEVIAAMQEAIKTYASLYIAPLGDFYPAGDEVVLVYETTGKLIPHSSIPLEIGVVVMNVETLWNLAQAEAGRPLTHKWVTVSGAVASPGTFWVPLGVSVRQMIDLAGGAVIADYAVIDGGPMMGRMLADLEHPVTKTTKGLLVLPRHNPVIGVQSQPLTTILRQARAMCCQCRLCTDLCPRNLLGYGINPNQTILAASYGGAQGDKALQSLLCSECGACDLYACPMGLSPRRVNQLLKAEVTKTGIKNPFVGKTAQPDAMRPYRRIPTKRLIRRLNLKGYAAFAPFYPTELQPDKVVLPLKQHIGSPAEAVVKAGEAVAMGQLVAEIPRGKLGSRIFASIAGRVSECSQERIVIERANS